MGKEEGHPKRCKRWDIPWEAHFQTFSCFRRRPFLVKDRTRLWFLEAIDAARTSPGLDLWGFVPMPEHVHLLLLPREGVPISGMLTAIKQPVSRRAVRFARQTNPGGLTSMLDAQPNGRRVYRFWPPGGGYDRNMRNVREVHEKLRYMHKDPVRRGLVERAEDWPWSSARTWADGTPDPLRIDRDSFPISTLDRP